MKHDWSHPHMLGLSVGRTEIGDNLIEDAGASFEQNRLDSHPEGRRSWTHNFKNMMVYWFQK